MALQLCLCLKDINERTMSITSAFLNCIDIRYFDESHCKQLHALLQEVEQRFVKCYRVLSSLDAKILQAICDFRLSIKIDIREACLTILQQKQVCLDWYRIMPLYWLDNKSDNLPKLCESIEDYCTLPKCIEWKELTEKVVKDYIIQGYVNLVIK